MIHENDHPVRLGDHLDYDKLAEVALALLSLTLHDECRAWKGLDWDLMNLLYRKGWIHDPVGKVKSVSFTENGLVVADEFLRKYFAKRDAE
jgi:hypothetical protein